MKQPALPQLSCKYGAPLGRENRSGRPESKVYVYQVNLEDGYDEGGAYWGSGKPLFHAFDAEENLYVFGRANSIKEMKDALCKRFPDIEFATQRRNPMSRSDIVREYKLNRDFGDPYGSAFVFLFDISAELYWRGELIAWDFSPGANSDPRDAESCYLEVIAEETTENLQKVGALFNRYLNYLEYKGCDY